MVFGLAQLLLSVAAGNQTSRGEEYDITTEAQGFVG
jgi:hypothetical protein